MSATREALLIAADARQDGRDGDAARVFDEIGATDFEIRKFSRTKIRELLAAATSRTVAVLLDPDEPYEAPSPMDDLVLGTHQVRAAYRHAKEHDAPEAVMNRLATWLGAAYEMLNPGVDAIEVRIKSWAQMPAMTFGTFRVD